MFVPTDGGFIWIPDPAPGHSPDPAATAVVFLTAGALLLAFFGFLAFLFFCSE